MTTPQTEQADSITLHWGSRSVAARLRLSERRVLKIEIDPEGVVTVHAPDGVDVDEITRRATQKGSWIFHELDVIAARPANTPQRRYVSGETHLFLGRQYRLQIEKADDAHVRCEGGRMIVTARDPDDQAHCGRLIKVFYALNARSVFRERLLIQAAPFERKGLKRPRLIVRDLSKRWGSFTPNGRVVLNVDLIRAAPDLIDYVISHELAHGLHPDHGPDWRNLLTMVMPDWEARKTRLEAALR
jgi:predicted metal-dependent hydrolase